MKIIEACGITDEEFFYEDYEHYEEDKYIFTKIKQLPPEKREALLKFL